MTQKELLDQLEQELRSVLETLRQRCAILDEKTLQRRPADPKGWTALECFEHLILHYGDYLAPMEMAIHKAKAHQFKAQPDVAVRYTWLGNMSMKWVKPGSTKRYKTAKRYNPLGRSLNASTLKSLIINIEKILRIIQMSRETDLNRTKVRFAVIPMFKFNLANLIEFIVAHTARHVNQALKLVE